MGNNDHRHTFAGKVLEDVQHFADEFGVKGRGRFVEEHEFGLHGHSASNGDPLLLATGQLSGVVVSPISHADTV